MSIRSVHSARAVRTNRSAIEFIRGACAAVGTTSIPQAVNTASSAVVNLVPSGEKHRLATVPPVRPASSD